jgi:5'-methylthioadenosine/S-adenosylhomocysteine nucleosidase
MIALLCATPMELESILPLISGASDAPSPTGTRLVSGKAGGRDILAFSAGVGKVPAAAGSRFLIDRYPLEVLVICGMAGALSPDVRLGDLIIASELVPGDVGVAHSGGFNTTGPGQCEGGRLVFHPTFPVAPSMLETASAAADAGGIPYRLGKVLTCDQIVLEPELRSHLGEVFDALAVEMEGAAAAQVAASEELPFFAVRAISDELSHDFVGFEKLLEYKGQSRRNIWHKRFRLAVSDTDTLARVKGMSLGRDLALETMTSFLRSYLA